MQRPAWLAQLARFARSDERSPRLRRVAGALLACLLAGAFWAPAFARPFATGFGDWQMVHHNWEVGYIALTRFGEWPLWNPFFCGGIPMFGNPESQHLSPLFALGLLLGTTLGTKVFLVVHAAVGLFGMYVLARRELRLHPLAAASAALVWGCSGFFAWHGVGGHATFLPFYFAPVLLYWFRRASQQPVYGVHVALLLTLVLLEGGTYPFPYFVLLLACDALCRMGSRQRVLGIARAVAILAPLTFLLGAIRLLPIREALARMPRLTASEDSLSLADVLLMLTAREHGWRFPPHEFVWPEYGTFIGVGALSFACVGVVVALRRRAYWIVIGLLAFLSLMLGQRGAYSPWALLHQLPVFDSLRVPSRFAVLFTFYLALCVGLAFDALVSWLQRVPSRVASALRHALPVALLLLLAGDLFVVNWKTLDRWSGPKLADAPPAADFHLLPTRNFHFLYASLPQKHLGIAGCYAGGMNWVVSRALVAGNVPQVRFSPAGGQLLSFARTVNTVSIDVRLPRTARLVINQNYDPDFRTNLGRIVSDRGRLAVELPAGHHALRLRYVPATLPAASGLFALGVLLALGIVLRARAASDTGHTRHTRQRTSR